MAESSIPLRNLCQNESSTVQTTQKKNTFSYKIVKVLISDEYGSQILSRFSEFREEERFCDVTVNVEGQDFKVHKMILAGCSDYFKALFSHGMKDSNMDTFQLREISLKGFRPLLDFSYTGKLKVNFELLPDVLSVATFLQIRPAIKLCQSYLKALMTLEDADEIVDLGMNYGLMELKEVQRRLILEHFVDFTQTKRFYELDHEILIDYVKDDSLRISTEGELLKCLLRWYRYDRVARDECIAEVLSCVRFVQQGWPIIDFADKNGLFAANRDCEALLAFSTKYMQEPHRRYMLSDYRTKVRFDRKSIIVFGGMIKPQTQLQSEFPFLENMLPGFDSEKVGNRRNYYYHSRLEKWIPLGCIGVSDLRSHCPLVYVNNHCVLIGGFMYTTALSQSYQHHSDEVKIITVSGTEFSMWDMPSLMQARAHHAVVATPNFLYAFGGKGESGALRSVEQFHLKKEQWRHFPSLPEALFDHAAAAVGESLYVSGGDEGGVITNTVLTFDRSCGLDDVVGWSVKPSMLHRRAGHTMTSVAHLLVVCGGHTRHDTTRCLSSVECYDVELQQWSYVTPMRQDCARMSATVLDEKLVILGGVDSAGDLLQVVQQYDVTQDTWSKLCDLPFPVQDAGVCALTVKLTDSGEPDTDSLCDDYEQLVLSSHGRSDEEEYLSPPSDDELEVELMM